MKKGKEKQAPQSHFPIVLLLTLLDRQTSLKTPTVMDSVAGLLDAVTRPLVSLKSENSPAAGATATSTSTATSDAATAAAGAERRE